MIQTVFGLEEVLVHQVVVRDMAIVAMRYFTVGAVSPSDVLRGHDVTIDAGLGVIRKIGGSITDFEKKKT